MHPSIRRCSQVMPAEAGRKPWLFTKSTSLLQDHVTKVDNTMATAKANVPTTTKQLAQRNREPHRTWQPELPPPCQPYYCTGYCYAGCYSSTCSMSRWVQVRHTDNCLRQKARDIKQSKIAEAIIQKSAVQPCHGLWSKLQRSDEEHFQGQTNDEEVSLHVVCNVYASHLLTR